MGFHVEINSILRSDQYAALKPGQVLPFKKSGSRVFFDDIPVWLTLSDWTALAEIQVISQARTPAGVNGEFQVLHVYSGKEQRRVTEMFRRMYAGGGDPFIYVLMPPATLRQATDSGIYAPESLASEKFIHASPSDQLTRIANKYYSNNDTVYVAVVCKTKVTAPIKWEPATGGIYPHIYGELNMDAVEKTMTFLKQEDNTFGITVNPA
ncbi:DUF952 domain-containing protein [Allorhodopirellula heiligendammensis]|uniref:Uncharacterized protein n=1 Tax=Allorhodopirellula heiligendammensis TaxID=2714739 RepID=A0A5C6BE35_9BACT|nr:DUF952 domain-containing protein [Allorhodopirellula heiligendammensis]TWU09731.1 hypothetical protein Poly21_55360 [Allorhodopirellula heiligendammensis]